MKSAAESNVFSRNYTVNIRGRLLDLSTPAVMGILNITPDSFFEGSRVQTTKEVVSRAAKMLEAGASIIDVGGHSTRPGAEQVPLHEEKSRVLMAISVIIKHFPNAIISCDTFNSETARAAVSEGASIINDVSGGELDKGMFTTVAQLGVPYILMHMRGNPQTMVHQTDYDNIQLEIITWLQRKVRQLHDAGVRDIIVDPGFGFSKTVEQNFQLLRRLDLFRVMGMPLLVGLSRKSMVWRTLGIEAGEALNGTTVLNTIALLNGASIIRVHDVREAVEAVKLFSAYQRS
jgi:dihydropteroate synthase